MFGGTSFGSAPYGGAIGAGSLLLARAGIAVAVTAELTIPAALAASPGLRVSVSATFAAPALQAAPGLRVSVSATLTTPGAYAPSIVIGGVDVGYRVRLDGLVIRDVLNDAPNTCRLTIEGDAPAVGQRLRVTITFGATAVVLFAGVIQSVEETYSATPAFPMWRVSAIDDTARANARRPFGTWTPPYPADVIATYNTTTWAPDFSTAGIQTGLPPVSIIFDGSETFIGCLSRLATAIGGYCKVEDNVVYLFLADAAAPPDPVDLAHPPLFEPPVAAHVDSSQLRTRVYGKGYGENITSDVAANETIVPIEDGATFPPLGGRLIAGTSPSAAQSEQLTYTNVELRQGGSVVGPGAAPGTAPVVVLSSGAGIESGTHEYAIVYVSGPQAGPFGYSLPSPRTAITVGTFPAPVTAPTAGTPLVGTGPDPGWHEYQVAYVTDYGETIPGPISNAVQTMTSVGLLPAPVEAAWAEFPTAGGAIDDGVHGYVMTFVNAYGETTPSTQVNSVEVGPGSPVGDPTFRTILVTLLRTGPPGTTARRIYRRDVNIEIPYRLVATIADNTTTSYTDTKPNSARGAVAPTSNTTGAPVQQIPLSAIPIGPSGTTGRKLYRRFNGAGTFRLVTTIGNNTATSYTDTITNAGLGAAALATPTAVGNQATVSWLASGQSAVTYIQVYRTPLGSTQLKWVYSSAGNAAGSYVDTTPDASLGQNAPTADDSGLKQPDGQVIPGSTSLIVASSTPFRAAGGWVELGGRQVVRFTGISGQYLTGIPASGPGSITTTVIYGSQAIPAPILVGVAGVIKPLLKGSAIHIWVQRDDLAAQAEEAARSGGDGVVEYLITDTRRGLESLAARCEADLKMFARPIVTVSYATRDIKTKSGKPVTVNLTAPPSRSTRAIAVSETLTIQDVTIDQIGIARGLAPRFTVHASTVRFSLEDVLRRMVAAENKGLR